jgi:hypothetical protein
MKINLIELKEKSKNRPEDYYDTVISSGNILNGFLYITPEVYKELLKKYDPTSYALKSPVSSCCGTPNIAMPPISQQIKTAGKAMLNVVSNTLSGKQVLCDAETIEKRKNICFNCEFWNKEHARCKVCGCYTKLKQQLASEKCPKNLW